MTFWRSSLAILAISGAACSTQPDTAANYRRFPTEVVGDSFFDLVDTRSVVPVGSGLLFGGRSDGLNWIDLAGATVVEVSRVGEGPTEYLEVSAVTPGRVPQEGIVVDRGAGRLLRVSMEGGAPTVQSQPSTILATGGFTLLAATAAGTFGVYDPPERDADGIGHVVRVGMDGSGLDSIVPIASRTYLAAQQASSSEVTSVFVAQPFAPDDLVAVTEAGEILILDSRRAVVRTYSADGRLQDSVLVAAQKQIEVTEEDIAPAVERFGTFFSESEIRAERYYPLFDSVRAGRGSSLLLATLGSPRSNSTTALLLSSRPQVLGAIEFPPGSSVVGFAPPLVVVSHGNELGLNRVLTYCIRGLDMAPYVAAKSSAAKIVCAPGSS
ncbi:MAG: hypothetical protein RQ751_03125 [Longimicrobiales bacterium]|nr:hypothetical protein [Longimicrobiales bacterium]